MRDILKPWIAGLREMATKKAGPGSPDQPSTNSSTSKPETSLPAAPRESVETIPLEIGDALGLLLSPEYIQIDSPHRLEETLLRPFCSGSKNLILIHPQNGKVTSAVLLRIQPEYLVVEVVSPTVLYERGDQMLVVFPILPKRQFILQTVIEDIDRDKVKLLYQDPRYEERSCLRISGDVSLYCISAEAVTSIVKRQVQIKRAITLSCDEISSTQKVLIADRLYDSGSARLSPYMQCFDAAPTFTCGLDNISLGGACLQVKGVHEQNEFLNHVVCLHFPDLPAVIGNTGVQLRLEPLAVIRNVRTTSELSYLHIQFLKRIPGELSVFFEETTLQSTVQSSI